MQYECEHCHHRFANYIAMVTHDCEAWAGQVTTHEHAELLYCIACYDQDEEQWTLPACDDYARLAACVREWNKLGNGIHYMVADFDDDALLAEIGALHDFKGLSQAAP